MVNGPAVFLFMIPHENERLTRDEASSAVHGPGGYSLCCDGRGAIGSWWFRVDAADAARGRCSGAGLGGAEAAVKA